MGIISAIKNMAKKIDSLTYKKEPVKPTKPIIKSPIKAVYFKVAGITFDDRQEKIEKMLKKAYKMEYLDKYDGMTNKEIKEYGDTVYEANHFYFDKLKLVPTKVEGEDAIEVYVEDIIDEEKYIMVGYVPKGKIKEVLEFQSFQKEHPEYKYKEIIELLGGKGKRVTYEGEVVPFEINYGIDISLRLDE